MTEPFFKDVPAFGSLYTDEILVECEYRLLFTLKDNRNNRYLCICFDTHEKQKWYLTPIPRETLIGLLRNRIPIAAPFKSPLGNKIHAVMDYLTRRTAFSEIDALGVRGGDLPGPDELLDAEEHEYDDYVARLYRDIQELAGIRPETKRTKGEIETMPQQNTIHSQEITIPVETVGDALDVFTREERKFRQLQVLERVMREDTDVASAFETALRRENLLEERETGITIVANVRSEAFSRLMGLRDAIAKAPLQGLSILPAVGTAPESGSTNLVPDLFGYGKN